MQRYDDDDDRCYMCEGKGVADCPLEYGGRHPESCPSCGGSQKVAPCPACDGTGKGWLNGKKPKSKLDHALDNMMSDAWSETKSDYSFGSALDKVASTAKLLGKGTFFLGVKTVQNLPELAKKAAEIQAKQAKK